MNTFSPGSSPGTISLGQGVVHFPPPKEATDRISRFLADPQNHKYKLVDGIPELLEALGRKLSVENKIALGPHSRVIVTAGGNMAFFNAILAIAIGLIVIYVWPKRRRLGMIWVIGVCAIYAIMALPVTAQAITNRLPSITIREATPVPVALLIVLDGDNRRGRAVIAQRILASTQPKAVWVLGSSWMIDPLLQAGVPDMVARHNPTAANTREQMRQVAAMSAKAAPGRTVVVASRLQVARVAALAAALNTNPDIVSAPVDDEPPTQGWRRFLPTYIALRVSRDALYEHAALWWYARQGWIDLSRLAPVTR